MAKITKYSEFVLTLLFGLVAYVFFAYSYQYHLHYQEQLQMFLFTADYWAGLMNSPGGLADYLSTFFIQFFYFSWSGALIIASMLVILQFQVSMLANKMKFNPVLFPLTFIPSILFWSLLCDENYLLTSLIAVILTLLSVQLYSFIKKSLIRIFQIVIFLLMLYWIAGGVFWVFGALALALEWAYFGQFNRKQWIIIIISFILCVALPSLVAKHFLQYPLNRLWWGLSYNRFPLVAPYPLLIICLSLVLIPVIFKFIPDGLKKNTKIIVGFTLLSIVIFFGYQHIDASTDSKKEEIMAYDYFVRMKDWDNVIAMANHKVPNNPLSVTCLNLALSKEGKMGDNMFHYFQNGTEGLLPGFQRDFTIPLIASEVYYHLGFLNTSMQYAFEAMEAIPDYKKSSRAFKRLAEVNLLNGEYKVASKYLHLLQQTLFYNAWATETLQCIGNEKRIDQNPEWAALRKYRLKDDFLFSDQEKSRMLYVLYTHCPTNRMAYEYLMAYLLLIKDLDHFIEYFPLGKNLGYTDIPIHYQEALILMWVNKTKSLDNAPWPISYVIKQRMNSYARVYTTNQNSEPLLRNEFSQTYWYYLHFRN